MYISRVILTIIVISVHNFYIVDRYNKVNYNMMESDHGVSKFFESDQDLNNLENVSKI